MSHTDHYRMLAFTVIALAEFSSCSEHSGVSKPNMIELTPGIGFRGCQVGMLESDVVLSAKIDLGESLVFGPDGRLMMIANVKSNKYWLGRYNLKVGDEASNSASELKPWDGDEKFAADKRCLVGRDGVIVSVDEAGKVESFTLMLKNN